MRKEKKRRTDVEEGQKKRKDYPVESMLLPFRRKVEGVW
jgi:hypothetical protein